MESIAIDLSQVLRSDTSPFPKVVDIDTEYPTILVSCLPYMVAEGQEAVKVTFANYVKRYKSENDSTHAERKARYAKNRRRWARKDLVSSSSSGPLIPFTLVVSSHVSSASGIFSSSLVFLANGGNDGANWQKQEKRSKARLLLDPSHQLAPLPQDAILFDYQSSEYSSSGNDSSESDDESHQAKVRRRKETWDQMRNADAGPSGAQLAGGKEYGWGLGLGMKLLEVRTPSWRSDQVSTLI